MNSAVKPLISTQAEAALLAALENLCNAVRDYERYGSEDDLAERQRCLDEAVNLVATLSKAA